MRFISLPTILERKEYLAKIKTMANHHGAGPPEARGPMQPIGCIGIRPALVTVVR